jgi:DNA polymerase
MIPMDLETRSNCDLKRCGGHVYAADPSTQIICGVWLIGGVYHVWVNPEIGTMGNWSAAVDAIARRWPGNVSPVDYVISRDPVPEWMRAAAAQPWVAHNGAAFDSLVWRACMPADVQPPEWVDTVGIARGAGLPGGLDQLGVRLLGMGKHDGQKILQKYYDRRKNPTLKDCIHAVDLSIIVIYNIVDVILLDRILQYLQNYQYEVDAIRAGDAINDRGIYVDADYCSALARISVEATARAAEEIARLTDGELTAANIRSNKQVDAWLRSQGVALPNLQRATIDAAIRAYELDGDTGDAEDAISPLVWQVMRLRQDVTRVTAGKFAAAIEGRCPWDNRIRGALVHHAAHTGRYSSRRVQMHNMTRPKKGIKVKQLLELYDAGQLSYDTIAATIPAESKLVVADALASMIRPMVCAPPGRRLLVCDLASVETRGLAWMSGDATLLRGIADEDDGRDPNGLYCQMASRIFGRTITRANDTERQIGKIVVLGSGYGMSHNKLALFCAITNVDLAAAGVTAEACTRAYRETYTGVVATWRAVDDAFRAAIDGRTAHAARCTFFRDGLAVRIRLPSGRTLTYHNAHIDRMEPAWAKGTGKLVPTICFMSPRGFVETTYGGKLVENIVQAHCRDLLVYGLCELEYRGRYTIGHAHDEIIVECDAADESAQLLELGEIMSTTPDWAEGMTLAAEGHSGRRYTKDCIDGLKVKSLRGAAKLT